MASGYTEHINLLALLRKVGTLNKSKVYGVVKREVTKPTNFQDNMKFDSDGVFVEVEVFAVNLSNEDKLLKENGLENDDNIYMVNGCLVTYLSKSSFVLDDWFEIDCTLRLGDRNPNSKYVVGFNFSKNANGWYLATCKCGDVDLNIWSHKSEAYRWLMRSSDRPTFERPDEVSNLERFNSVMHSFKPFQEASGVSSSSSRSLNQSITKQRFKKESRQKILEESKIVRELRDILATAKSNRKDMIKFLKSKYGIDGVDETPIWYMISQLQKFKKHSAGNSSTTGRKLLKGYLSHYNGFNKVYMNGVSRCDYLIDIFDDIVEYMKDSAYEPLVEGECWDLCKIAFGDIELFYVRMVAEIVKVSLDSMVQAYDICVDNDLSLVSILNENPYMLIFVSDYSFSDIEKIATAFSHHNDRLLARYRNLCIVHSYISSKERGDTIFHINKLKNNKLGVEISGLTYKIMGYSESLLTENMVANTKAYIKNGSKCSYQSEFQFHYGNKHIKAITPNEVVTAIEDYKESGLGVGYQSYITSTNLLEKELVVYDTFYRLGSQVEGYDHDEIDEYIDEYESMLGFKLEPEQRLAVHLIDSDSFIVSGGAGSGKTTTSGCIVYVLSKLENDLDIKFVAPTGKAAKRLQEVVKSKAETLHSCFKIGQASNIELEKQKTNGVSCKVAYFCDEGGMISLDLLYSVAKKLDTNSCRFYFFGDIDQLPPIGKGLPFKNLLRFLPCVFLAVSKRAVEGSNITANSHIINEYSETDNWKPLESADDFRLLECSEDMIASQVYSLCAYFLGKLDDSGKKRLQRGLGVSDLPVIDNIGADDIQVVTPLTKPKYKWGSIALNRLLQPLFNPRGSYATSFMYKPSEASIENRYIIGDRVIHCEKNLYSMQWYSSYKDGEFQKVYGNGICNGEVGKLVDFRCSTCCEFIDEQEDEPEGFSYPDNLRDDSTWYGDDKWFAVVEYHDYLDDRNIYVVYRMERSQKVNNTDVRPFKGDDLKLLNLFYAGTVHKEQGSQAKVVICPLGVVDFGGFITRQLIYTAVTRGEKLVVMVGSVGNNESSMLSVARKDVATVNTRTLGEILY